MDQVDENRERQRKAREYARQRRFLFFLQLSLAIAYLLAFVFGGLSLRLRVLLAPALQHPALLLAGFFLVLFLVYELVSLPLSVYGGYVLPHRYDLSLQSLSDWAADAAKGSALSLAFGLVVVEAVYWLMNALPDWWWLAAGAIIVALDIVLAFVGPVLLMPLFYRLKPLHDQELASSLEDMAARAGARVRGVYVIEFSRKTRAANAALTGLGRTRRIVLGDTLLDSFTRRETEAVFAHELGHHVHADIVRLLTLQAGLVLASLYLIWRVLPIVGPELGLAQPADVAGLPLLALMLAAFGLVTMPLANAFSRWLENAADEYALRATDDPAAFRSAMAKLADQNLAEREPPAWVVYTLYDHPAIGQRLRHAERYSTLRSRR